MLDHLILLNELHLCRLMSAELHGLSRIIYDYRYPGRTFFQRRLEYIVELGFPSKLAMKSMTASCFSEVLGLSGMQPSSLLDLEEPFDALTDVLHSS